MNNPGILIFLTFLTLAAALVWGFYQLYSVDQSKKKGSHLDGTKDNPGAGKRTL